MIPTHQMSNEELIILWHRLNLSIIQTKYYTKEWREKFQSKEHAIGWSMYSTISNELKKRDVDPHTYLDTKPKEEPIYIGTYPVEFAVQGDAITVGCERVDFDTMKLIVDKLEDIQKQYSKEERRMSV